MPISRFSHLVDFLAVYYIKLFKSTTEGCFLCRFRKAADYYQLTCLSLLMFSALVTLCSEFSYQRFKANSLCHSMTGFHLAERLQDLDISQLTKLMLAH